MGKGAGERSTGLWARLKNLIWGPKHQGEVQFAVATEDGEAVLIACASPCTDPVHLRRVAGLVKAKDGMASSQLENFAKRLEEPGLSGDELDKVGKEVKQFAMDHRGLHPELDALAEKGNAQGGISLDLPKIDLHQKGALKMAAAQVHQLARTPGSTSNIAVNQSTVAIAEAVLEDGSSQIFASGNNAYLLPRQVERLVELGIPRENILSGSKYSKGFTRLENHAERVIIRELNRRRAKPIRWGIDWAGSGKGVPCDNCEPFVRDAGGQFE